MSLSLGRTEHDTAILGWTGVGTSGNGMVTVDIPDGVDTWVKLRATNNGEMTTSHHWEYCDANIISSSWCA